MHFLCDAAVHHRCPDHKNGQYEQQNYSCKIIVNFPPYIANHSAPVPHLTNKLTKSFHMVCRDAFWFALRFLWVFLCEKEPNHRKKLQVYKLKQSNRFVWVYMESVYLQVIEDEEESFCGQSLVELYGVRVMRWDLMMEGQGGTWIPHQVLPLRQKQKTL